MQFFQKSISLYLIYKDNKNEKEKLIWYRIVLSYCKFLINGMNDYYRPFLIALKTIIQMKENKNDNLDNEEYQNKLDCIIEKYEFFCEKYRKEYTNVLNTYYPELKQVNLWKKIAML